MEQTAASICIRCKQVRSRIERVLAKSSKSRVSRHKALRVVPGRKVGYRAGIGRRCTPAGRFAPRGRPVGLPTECVGNGLQGTWHAVAAQRMLGAWFYLE